MRTFEIPFRIAVYVVYSMDGDFINLKLQLIVEQNMILAIFDLRNKRRVHLLLMTGAPRGLAMVTCCWAFRNDTY